MSRPTIGQWREVKRQVKQRWITREALQALIENGQRIGFWEKLYPKLVAKAKTAGYEIIDQNNLVYWERFDSWIQIACLSGELSDFLQAREIFGAIEESKSPQPRCQLGQVRFSIAKNDFLLARRVAGEIENQDLQRTALMELATASKNPTDIHAAWQFACREDPATAAFMCIDLGQIGKSVEILDQAMNIANTDYLRALVCEAYAGLGFTAIARHHASKMRGQNRCIAFTGIARYSKLADDVALAREAARDINYPDYRANLLLSLFELSKEAADLAEARDATTGIIFPSVRARTFAKIGAASKDPADFSKAKSALAEVNLDYQKVEATWDLGVAYANAGKFTEAKAIVTATPDEPDKYLALAKIGNAYAQNSHFEEAIDIVETIADPAMRIRGFVDIFKTIKEVLA